MPYYYLHDKLFNLILMYNEEGSEVVKIDLDTRMAIIIPDKKKDDLPKLCHNVVEINRQQYLDFLSMFHTRPTNK